MKFKKGKTYYILIPAINKMKKYKIHILTLVDTSYVVYKWYGKHKQWWHYEIEHKEFLEMKIKRALNLK